MSECHDIYDPTGYPSESPLGAEATEVATQCHDPYSAVGVVSGCRLSTDQQGRVPVLRVMGRLDRAACGEFRALIQNERLDPLLIVDLSGASSDAAGTGVLLAATARAVERGQRLVFVVSDPLELEVLVSAGLDRVVPIVASESEAQKYFGAQEVETSGRKL